MALKGVNETVKVDNKISPDAVTDKRARVLHKEGLLLELVSGRREVDAAFSLHGTGGTLLRSLTTSSIFQAMPGSK